MLRSIRAMLKADLHATDGDIGRCVDFLFDDKHWTIRYMVADPGKWLRGRKVLIAATSLGDWDWRSDEVAVGLSRNDIKTSPPLSSDMPVSLRYEQQLAHHYGWFPYSHGPCVWSGALNASAPLASNQAGDIEAPGEHHLRSVREVCGYHVQAQGDPAGCVDDFLVEPYTWTIRYLVVDMHRWMKERKILIPPLWTETVDWKRQRLNIHVNRRSIAESPAYDQRKVLDREDEHALFKHYGRRPCWKNGA
jgi:hypothetical protein